MRPMLRAVRAATGLALASLLLAGASGSARAQAPQAASTDAPAATPSTTIVVLPFRVHSGRPLEHLGESLPQLLANRLEGTGTVSVAPADRVAAALAELRGEAGPARAGGELEDAQLRELARGLAATAVVTGSITELAGRFSMDVRITPVEAGLRSHTVVYTAESNQELVDQVGELSEQVLSAAAGDERGRIVGLTVDGAGELEPELRGLIQSQPGTAYDPNVVKQDRARLEAHERVARATVETERKQGGVVLIFSLVRAEMILGGTALEDSGQVVDEILIRGNRRIEADAIRTRIQTREGEPLNRNRLARDVQEIHSLGFFRSILVFAEEQPAGGVRLVFEVEENPVIRQIAITGNDKVDSDKIKDILTLTTGSSLDYPLLHENKQRIDALYRAEGYHKAKVKFEVENEREGAVSINFEVSEGEKLKLRKIRFVGNEGLSDSELMDDFNTKRWRFWSYLTSWFDKSGTYSEPIFNNDLRGVEKKYTDSGYLQVEVGRPELEISDDGLVVEVEVREGPEFKVGSIDVAGDETVDLDALRKKLRLEQGAIFNRSYLTADVETLERHYTDRGFFLASVQPGTRINTESQVVDVQFSVEKGPLYFVRNIEISGNTQTIDPVIRREMRVVEGQLYSARGIQVSTRRIRNLGFFEDINFEPKPTEDPEQLDLDVSVVERPTGSFSFGAGFSSQDSLVFTASLSQQNLFGRGYFVNFTVDIGGRTSRYYVQLVDPYFLGSTFSLGTTLFLTDVNFDDFEQTQRGFAFTLSHKLSADGDSVGALRYNFASRRVRQDSRFNASAAIQRQILQDNESSSRIGLSFSRDTRNDRFAATSGTNLFSALEYSGIGGFAKFLRAEARFAWYMGAPDWLINRSTFVASTRLGYTVPFNTVSDYDLLLGAETLCDDPANCDNVARLDQIDTDLKLPLTERYFLGGIGSFQLRGYRARSVGPRRAILQRSGIFGEGDLFHPVGTKLEYDAANGRYVAVCEDDPFGPTGTQGDGDGVCNTLGTKDISDFADLDETDVIGGNSFISSSVEYRFPISEEVGLQGVFFLDGGNAFYEGQNLFDAREWRYGYGGGVLWFSPFGPLQLVLGFPVDPRPNEESPVFEFSVGGFGL